MNSNSDKSPGFANRVLRSFIKKELIEEVEGDLLESYQKNLRTGNRFVSTLIYWYQVIQYLRPFALKNLKSNHSNFTIMLPHLFKISLRRMIRNFGFTTINIGGLTMGLITALFISLWVSDELNFNKYHNNYEHIGRIVNHQTINNETQTGISAPRPLEFILREDFNDLFEHIIMSSWTRQRVVSAGENSFYRPGTYMQEGAGEMLGLQMISGSHNNLDKPENILLARSTAVALFGENEALGKSMLLEDKYEVVVSGVYEDIPANSNFHNLKFIASWKLYVNRSEWIQSVENRWDFSFLTFVQKKENISELQINEAIKDIPKTYSGSDHMKTVNAQFMLYPMSKWHLYDQWKNGELSGGRISYVRLFSIIGLFVMGLACINFINLSTARSEKRSREVGIRKAIGSKRNLLIGQFLYETTFMVLISFVIAIILVQLIMPLFNQITGKSVEFPWTSAIFWLATVGLILLTSFISSIYPALYLSSFNPVKVLKGKTPVGKTNRSIRRGLVIFQFTISIAMIIGTSFVYLQILHTKNRPVGFNQNGLIQIASNAPTFFWKYSAIRNEILQSNAVLSMAGSHSPATDIWSHSGGFNWEGKPDDLIDLFGIVRVDHDYGKTMDWKITEGRDFNRERVSDSTAVILNKAAVSYMGIDDPVGKTIRNGRHEWEIIGVVDNLIMQSPYLEIKPTIYYIDAPFNFYIFRLNPKQSVSKNVAQIESIYNDFLPGIPFEYTFIDDAYAAKFENEERIGIIARIFTFLAIIISALGLYGLASFMAERRYKEIGIRKALGASIPHIWKLLSGELLILVILSNISAFPIAYYFMSDWLSQYEYNVPIYWWVFLSAGWGALFISLVVISFQTIRASIVSPVDSLHSE